MPYAIKYEYRRPLGAVRNAATDYAAELGIPYTEWYVPRPQ